MFRSWLRGPRAAQCDEPHGAGGCQFRAVAANVSATQEEACLSVIDLFFSFNLRENGVK